MVLQKAEGRKHRAESRKQRAESREQRAESRKHRAESREQRAESRKQILLEEIFGPRAQLGAQSFWADAALLDEAGIASVLFGQGGAGLLSTVECVNLEDVALCAETLVECARELCNS